MTTPQTPAPQRAGTIVDEFASLLAELVMLDPQRAERFAAEMTEQTRVSGEPFAFSEQNR